MSCTNYVHNDPIGGSKYISGTTCTGTVAYYTLTLGQSICMNNSLPLVNLNGLVISGDCTGVTPTPTPTPIDYCYLSGFTYQSAIFQCPNDGLDYFDTYGVWTFSAYTGSQFTNDHPELNFTLTNGTDYAVVTIESNQYFTEFIYPKVDFRYTDTGCISTTYPDWYIAAPPVTRCVLTPTPTPTITSTSNPVCPQELYFSGTNIWSGYTGTYTRQTTFTAGTYDGAYRSSVSGAIVYGPDASGTTWSVWAGPISGTQYKQILRQIGGTENNFAAINSINGYWFNGFPLSGVVFISDTTNYTLIGNIGFPAPGPYYFGSVPVVNITYPITCPTPTPSSTTTQTPTPTLTKTPTPTPTVTSTPAQTTTISLTPTQTITPTISLTPTNTLTPTISLTPTNTLTPTISLTPTNTLTPTITPTRTPTPTRTQTPTITPTKTITPSITKTPTQTPNLGLYWNVNEYDCDCNLLRSNIVLRTNQTLYPSSTNFVSFNNYPNYIFKILSSITWPGYHDVEVLNFTTVYTNANCNLIPC